MYQLAHCSNIFSELFSLLLEACAHILTLLASFLLVFVEALEMTHASKCLMEAFDVEKSHVCDGKKMQSNIVEGQNDSVIQATECGNCRFAATHLATRIHSDRSTTCFAALVADTLPSATCTGRKHSGKHVNLCEEMRG